MAASGFSTPRRQANARRLALARLELPNLFVDDVDPTATPHDLARPMAVLQRLQGSHDLHGNALANIMLADIKTRARTPGPAHGSRGDTGQTARLSNERQPMYSCRPSTSASRTLALSIALVSEWIAACAFRLAGKRVPLVLNFLYGRNTFNQCSYRHK